MHPEYLINIRARVLKFNTSGTIRRRGAGSNQAANREGTDTSVSVVLRWMRYEVNEPGATPNQRLAEAVQVSGYQRTAKWVCFPPWHVALCYYCCIPNAEKSAFHSLNYTHPYLHSFFPAMFRSHLTPFHVNT